MKKILLLITFIFTFLSLNAQENIKWLGFEEAIELNKKNPKPILIDVYTDWCGYCKKVKQIFAQKGVAYKEFNIETSSQSKKEFKALGGNGVPLTLINGTAVHGYNPNKIKQLVSEI